MTLAMSLVVLGLANVWQLIRVQTGSGVPSAFRTLGANMVFGFLPLSLVLFIPLAILVMFLLNRTGFGRLLYAIGDNPVASRLSGTKSWQVLIVLYVISAILAGIAGFLYSGLTNVASVTLADSALLPSVAAAVIGGTSILGGRGGYSGTMIGALILAVISSILSSLGYPEAIRQILFGAMIVFVAAAYTRITSD
jgi:ribose transport system permease protein